MENSPFGSIFQVALHILRATTTLPPFWEWGDHRAQQLNCLKGLYTKEERVEGAGKCREDAISEG